MTTESKYTLNGRLIGPYQKEGVQWMFGMEHQESGPKGGFLCDEMGLGKTVQLLATILANPQPRTLIIVPKSIITQWHEEIGKFAPELSVNIYDGPERKVNEMTDITIAPYTVLTVKGGGVDALTPLHHMKWDRVILDEGHEIRNKSSKLFKSVCRLRTDIKWIVTGTPVFNSMEDFVSLCTFLGIPKNLFKEGLKRSKISISFVEPRMISLRLTNVFGSHLVRLKMWNLICLTRREHFTSVFFSRLRILSKMPSKMPKVLTPKIWSFWSASSVPGSV
jgi:hypothetical protein